MAIINTSINSSASFEDLSLEFWNEASWNDEEAFLDTQKNLSPEINTTKLQTILNILSQNNLSFSSFSEEMPNEEFYKNKVSTNRRTNVVNANNPVKIKDTEKNHGLLGIIEKINTSSNKIIINSIKKDVQLKSNTNNYLKDTEININTMNNSSQSKNDLYLFYEGECAYSRSLEEMELIEAKLATIQLKKPIEQSINSLAPHLDKKISSKEKPKKTRRKSSRNTEKKTSLISDFALNNSSQKKT